MKKTFKIIKYVILTVLFILYAALIIGMSTLVLNRNQFGYTRFGINDWLFITSENESKDYKAGSLVITEIKLVDELKAGEKVFVYQTNEQKQEVKVIYQEIQEVVSNNSTKYIKLKDGTSWGEEYIAGQAVGVYENIGLILSVLESRWVFFSLLIVPVFFILLIEIYNFIITIKYEDEDEEEEKPKSKEIKPEVKQEPVQQSAQQQTVNTNEQPQQQVAPTVENKVEQPQEDSEEVL